MEGQVRKLLQGPPKEGMVYIVGQTTKIGLINDILLDTQHFEKFGTLMWNVYVETKIGTQLWKQIPAHNCTIEYNLV
jgi:hypothetical protein